MLMMLKMSSNKQPLHQDIAGRRLGPAASWVDRPKGDPRRRGMGASAPSPAKPESSEASNRAKRVRKKDGVRGEAPIRFRIRI